MRIKALRLATRYLKLYACLLALVVAACSEQAQETHIPTEEEIKATEALQEKLMAEMNQVAEKQNSASEQTQVDGLENLAENDRQTLISETLEESERLNAEEAKAMLEAIGGIEMDDDKDTQSSNTDDE